MPTRTAEKLTLREAVVDFEPPRLTYGPLTLRRESGTATLCGPNGCGKTSLALALTGAIPKAIWARVEIDCVVQVGSAQHSCFDSQSGIHVLPESWRHGLLGYAARDEIVLGTHTRDDWTDRVTRALELHSLSDVPVARLSDGERQRLLLGVALVVDPVLLLSDEWALHLDPDWRRMGEELLHVYTDIRGGFHVNLTSTRPSGGDGRVLPLVGYAAAGSATGPSERAQGVDMLCAALEEHVRDGEGGRQKSVHANVRYSPRHRRRLWVDAESGEILEILGVNGSGKTTLLRNLWRLSHRWAISRRLSHVSISPVHLVQANPRYQVLAPSVADELARCIGGDADSTPTRRIVADFSRAVGCSADQDTLSLSFGQRKVLAALVALLSGRNVLALDEPFAGLDATNRGLVSRILSLAALKGKTVLTTGQEPAIGEATQLTLER